MTEFLHKDTDDMTPDEYAQWQKIADNACERLVANWFKNKATPSQIAQLRKLSSYERIDAVYKMMDAGATQTANGVTWGVRMFTFIVDDYWNDNYGSADNEQ